MPTLLLTFANSDTHKLLTLTQEYDGVNQALRERFANGDFVVVSEPFTTPEKIIDLIRSHERSITLFSYSGHAGRDRLLLEDGEGHDRGMASLLGHCPNLKLVILNGCSTAGQVKLLKEKGVPVVIATSAPVDDYTATQFAISFFKELAQRRKSIREAFERAVDAAQVRGKVDTIEITSRGLGSNKEEEAIWGLYYDESNRDILDSWRLPERDDKDTVPNQYLRESIKGIFDEQLKNKEESANPQDIVLKRMPYLISEPIRKLLAPRDASAQIFYDSPSEDRAAMLLYAYRSLINFLTFSLLGQLWKEKLRQPALDLSSLTEVLKKWMVEEYNQESKRSLLPLYNQLVELLRANKIPFFFEELDDALLKLNEPDFAGSISFLEEKLAATASWNQENIPRLCDELEQHLAVLLYYYGFLVHYSLTSVKDIEVLFYMHELEARYEHKVVRLQQQVTALEDSVEMSTVYYKTASILLRSTNDKTRYLYLSPFLIDENAYTKTTKANLRYFASFNRTGKQFFFKHVSKPGDVLEIKKKYVSPLDRIKGIKSDENDYYQLINEQFGAFCKTVLGQSLDTL
jgi:hypothetical protein